MSTLRIKEELEKAYDLTSPIEIKKKLRLQGSCLYMFQLIMYFHESLFQKKINKNQIKFSYWHQIVVTCNEMGLLTGAALTSGRCCFKYGMPKLVPQYLPTASLLFYQTYFHFN
jgi:hypothetical protein